MDKNSTLGKSIPYNPNTKISDDEINSLLELAASQVHDDKKQKTKKIETKKIEEERKKAEAKKREEELKKAEAKKREEELKKAEAKKREEELKKAEAKKREELKKAEAKKKEEELKKAEAKKREEERKKTEAKKREEELKKAEAKKREEELKKAEAKKKEEKEPEERETDDDWEEKWTFGRILGTFFEGLWTIVKICVIVCVVTVISGFFLSRDLMIRGRNGDRQCLKDMVSASNVLSNREAEVAKANSWLQSVKGSKITLEADDGKILVARKYVKDENDNRWAVVLHGYGDDMEDVYDIAMHYSDAGYNVLLPDLRAHGESEGAFYGMGWLDRLDIINWIDVILEENPSANVVIHGIDMGADAALMLSGEPIKSNIKAIVAEGAYPTAWDVVKEEYKTRHPKLPTFPFLYMINPVMKVWAGYSLTEADAVKQVKKTNVPILLIAGNNDTYVDSDMTNELDQAIASSHEVFTIANGAHGDCRYADSEAYYDKVFQFTENYVD